MADSDTTEDTALTRVHGSVSIQTWPRRKANSVAVLPPGLSVTPMSVSVSKLSCDSVNENRLFSAVRQSYFTLFSLLLNLSRY